MPNFADGSYGLSLGKDLIAKVLSGRCQMRYTRVAVGKGHLSSTESPKNMENVVDYVMDATIQEVSNPLDGECQITVQINSDNVSNGFHVTNMVVFAEDPDLGEVPFTYVYLENHPEWIGSEGSNIGKITTFEIVSGVGDIENVSAVLNPLNFATKGEVERLIIAHNTDQDAHGGDLGQGCYLNITFGSDFNGRQYTISSTSGERIARNVPSTLKDVVKVKNCQTEYTISSTNVSGRTYSSSIITGNYFGYYDIVLSAFRATIRINASPDSTVTVELEDKPIIYNSTVTSSGYLEVNVVQPGIYKAYSILNGVKSDIMTINVTTNGNRYSEYARYTTLIVNAPIGNVIRISRGDTTLTQISTGQNTFYLKEKGEWLVELSDGNDKTSKTVQISQRKTTIEMRLHHIYGVEWGASSSSKWTRTDDSALFVDPVPYVPKNSKYGSPFDNLKPWSGMIRVEREAGAMVAIPKFWYKITSSGNGGLKIQISDKAVSGFFVSPAHQDRKDGQGERDVVYIARYHCAEGHYKSRTWEKPQINISMQSARDAVRALGTSVYQLDFLMLFTIWILYLVEFADWNSQAGIGYGCGNGIGVESMGYTDTMPYHTGTMQTSRNQYGVGTQYRNIEGLWENVFDWVEGIYCGDGARMAISVNPKDFADARGGILTSRSSGTGYPVSFNITNDTGFPLFIPRATRDNAEETHACDYWGLYMSDDAAVAGGSYMDRSSAAGLFSLKRSLPWSPAVNVGCRLQELP